jgi:hypothetical protein
MKRRLEAESGFSAQAKKSAAALSMQVRLNKESEHREKQARAHREKMEGEKRIEEEREAKEVLEL